MKYKIAFLIALLALIVVVRHLVVVKQYYKCKCF